MRISFMTDYESSIYNEAKVSKVWSQFPSIVLTVSNNAQLKSAQLKSARLKMAATDIRIHFMTQSLIRYSLIIPLKLALYVNIRNICFSSKKAW